MGAVSKLTREGLREALAEIARRDADMARAHGEVASQKDSCASTVVDYPPHQAGNERRA